ncbi:MAG TPA: hypothetical protein VIF34_16680 [Methylocystis sp.]
MKGRGAYETPLRTQTSRVSAGSNSWRCAASEPPASLAAQIYGLYTGFVYLTPILGGIIADRWLDRRRTVALGAALMVAGHFLMASEPLFLLALLALVLGNGAFKPDIVAQVSGLYAPDDLRRDRAYSIFYVGMWGRSYRRSSAARSARCSSGAMASPALASGWRLGL